MVKLPAPSVTEVATVVLVAASMMETVALPTTSALVAWVLKPSSPSDRRPFRAWPVIWMVVVSPSRTTCVPSCRVTTAGPVVSVGRARKPGKQPATRPVMARAAARGRCCLLMWDLAYIVPTPDTVGTT
ncbi:hypothetical protein D3C86_922310 [compost metagenome]